MWTASDSVRLGAGVLDLALTRTQAGLELGSPPTEGDVLVYRVLGARQAVQAVVAARTGWRALGAVVDVLHLASMLPVALGSRRWRRAALVQIAFAGALIAASVRD